MVSVSVKHRDQTYNVDLGAFKTGKEFKAELSRLTNVPCNTLKLLVKGGQLKDDQDLSALNFSDGQKLIMIGLPSTENHEKIQAEALDAAKKIHEQEAQQKLRDLNAEREEEANFPVGLYNLGNTCYMNSTIQVMKAMPDLRKALSSCTDHFLMTLQRLLASIDSGDEPFVPRQFLAELRAINPQFAERAQGSKGLGGFAQQDAEECWSTIINQMNMTLPRDEKHGKNWLEKYMQCRIRQKMRCLENVAEEVTVTEDTAFKLSCHINKKTNFMTQGLQESFVESITKESPTLSKDASYEKKTELIRLPKYLVVTFVRFLWKTSTNVKSKILRPVAFPFEFDALEYCSEDLRKALRPLATSIKTFQKDFDNVRLSKKPKTDNEDVSNYENEDRKHSLEKIKEIQQSLDEDIKCDEGANITGLYDLKGVLTHQGASADSGHYKAWVSKGNSEHWYCFNDEKVTIVNKSDIERLKGHSESDCAYILLYQAKDIPEE